MTRQCTPASLHRHKTAAFIIAMLFVSVTLMGTAQAAGELDMSFGNGGRVLTDFSELPDFLYDMVVQPDGKIVAVGVVTVRNSSNTSSDLNFGLVRYNSDGSLDTTFGTGGKVSTDFMNGSDIAYSVALQADGKIVVVGSSVMIIGSSNVDSAIARYNSDGTLDSTFGNGGKVITDFNTSENAAKAVVIQSDNKIVVGGFANILHQFGWHRDFVLVRYHSDGSLDTTFDGDGVVTTDFSGPQNSNSADDITSLALMPDGRILAGGSNYGNNGNLSLARYNANGSLDTTFDTDGKVFNPLGSNAGLILRSMVVQPDGKIVTAGKTWYNISYPAFGVVRLNTDGSLDTTFGGDGLVVTPPAFSGEFAADVALTAGGKIVVAGHTSVGSYSAARYLSNGDLDISFSRRGRLFTYLRGTDTTAYATAIQADGKILIAGITPGTVNFGYNDFAIVRTLANPIAAPVRSDFDGDGRTDVAVFRPSSGYWYVMNSSNGEFRGQPFGTNGDIAAPGDYDGDLKTDFAVFRPSNGYWYILNSSDNSFRAEHFGTSGDAPVAGDYDGDAKTDVAVYRSSNNTWYTLRSSDNAFQAQVFGSGADRPVPGYYDDDEKADLAVWRESNGTWYFLQSATNTIGGVSFGNSGDIPVTGNWDDDGRFDYAVYRPSTGNWYILRTMNLQWTETRWGAPGDIPVPGDYDGDFLMEIAVWRPSDGGWYTPNWYAGFGASGDTPVPAAYRP